MPSGVRGFALAIAVFVLWCTKAILSFVFPLLNSALEELEERFEAQGVRRRR